MVLGAIASSLAAAIFFIVIIYIIARVRNRRYDLIDVAWGPIFIVIAWVNVIRQPFAVTAIIMAIMVTVWGARLASHILRRWVRSPVEDRRYSELRKMWPQRALDAQVFVRIYLLQAVLAIIVSLPVIVFILYPSSSVYTWIGATIWLIGIVCEATADRQLAAFLANPNHRGMLMTRGLWRYSRHPNYFGEMVLWWGIAIMGLGTPLGTLGLLGPAAISLLIAFVSGIPPAERGASEKPGWQAYKAATSPLIPWPPRK